MYTGYVHVQAYVHVFICRRPSLSQKLSELAQHVDVREERADDDNEREEGKKKQEEEEGASGKETKSLLAMGIYILKTQVHKHMYLYKACVPNRDTCFNF